MDIQEQITKLANEYDPDYEVDAQASRALLQGTIWGLVQKTLSETPAGQVPRVGACAVAGVVQEVDDDGSYRNYFIIKTGAGHQIKVTFEAVK